MKKITITLLSLLFLFSFFTVFSKPNPNSTSVTNKAQALNPSLQKGIAATPEVVKDRLEALSTEIEMTYDGAVQANIDTYIKYGKKHMTDLLERCAYYLPIFESALEEAGLPDELKYIPVIESHLKATVTSNRGAGGLWQFMPIAAKGYDMQITSAIDERCDPYLSSNRACRMLKDLYAKFGDWTLVLAAYNAGPGTVQRALKRAGGDKSQHTFWTIAPYLPAQTRKYVPKFIAATYIMNYYEHHNLQPDVAANPQATDTIHVNQKTSLSKIAGTLNVPVTQLRSLNPHLRSDMVPATASRHCNLIIPADSKRMIRNI